MVTGQDTWCKKQYVQEKMRKELKELLEKKNELVRACEDEDYRKELRKSK